MLDAQLPRNIRAHTSHYVYILHSTSTHQHSKEPPPYSHSHDARGHLRVLGHHGALIWKGKRYIRKVVDSIGRTYPLGRLRSPYVATHYEKPAEGPEDDGRLLKKVIGASRGADPRARSAVRCSPVLLLRSAHRGWTVIAHARSSRQGTSVTGGKRSSRGSMLRVSAAASACAGVAALVCERAARWAVAGICKKSSSSCRYAFGSLIRAVCMLKIKICDLENCVKYQCSAGAYSDHETVCEGATLGVNPREAAGVPGGCRGAAGLALTGG
eukprot:scaffold16050_cov121-Isochrysis_galbana.AAC.3